MNRDILCEPACGWNGEYVATLLAAWKLGCMWEVETEGGPLHHRTGLIVCLRGTWPKDIGVMHGKLLADHGTLLRIWIRREARDYRISCAACI